MVRQNQRLRAERVRSKLRVWSQAPVGAPVALARIWDDHEAPCSTGPVIAGPACCSRTLRSDRSPQVSASPTPAAPPEKPPYPHLTPPGRPQPASPPVLWNTGPHPSGPPLQRASPIAGWQGQGGAFGSAGAIGAVGTAGLLGFWAVRGMAARRGPLGEGRPGSGPGIPRVRGPRLSGTMKLDGVS